MKRQGDILFVPVTQIPFGLKIKEDCVIAEGEKNGHKHVLGGGILLNDSKIGMFIKVEKEEAFVTHNEHAPIILLKGFYQVKRQREYEPGGWRHISD